MYQLTTLKNKLKIITHSMPNAHGVTAGIFVNTGSRYESDKIAGISHFIEHMVFKGTSKRPTPKDISEAIESVGGYLNAATSQDYTFFYNRVPFKHCTIALDVLADMINDPLFDKSALERERGVIIEELNMYLDTPIRYIYDLIMQTIWPGNSLGRDIIGTIQSIKSVQPKDFITYLKSHYQPQNMVLSLAGKINHKEIVSQARKYFSQNKNSQLPKFKPVTKSKVRSNIKIFNKPTDQVHLSLAFPALPRGHKDEITLALLDAILGTGMSSRLFLNIREKRGLCYSIQSFNERFSDTGIFGITAGLNTNKLDLALQAILAEIKDLTQHKVKPQELNKAKEYIKGSIQLQMDNPDNMAIYYGSQALFYKKIQTPEQKIKQLLKVSDYDIIKLANSLFNKNKLNLALIGPFKPKDKARFAKLLTI